MSDTKELDFFIEEKNWRKGKNWYRAHFPKSADILGETSPNYTKFPAFSGVPERMHRMIPKAKLIYLVRDPIERMVSHYLHQYTDRAEHRSLQEALSKSESNHYIFSSRYAFQIEQFLKYYDESALLIVNLADLSKQPVQTLKKVFEFLDIDPTFTHPSFHKVFHQSKQKRKLTWLGEAAFNLPAGGRLMKIIPDLLAEEVRQPIINDELRSRLLELLHDDIEKIEAIAQQRFWHYS